MWVIYGVHVFRFSLFPLLLFLFAEVVPWLPRPQSFARGLNFELHQIFFFLFKCAG